MKARALLIEALVGIASAAVAAGSFCWMVKYTVLKEADMIVIAAFLWLWVACKLLTWANRRNTHLKKGTGRNSGDLPGLSEMSDHKKGSPEQ